MSKKDETKKTVSKKEKPDVDVSDVVEEVATEIKNEKKILKKIVTREELRKLEKEGRLIGNGPIKDDKCEATFKG